jgi:hypothetical protein
VVELVDPPPALAVPPPLAPPAVAIDGESFLGLVRAAVRDAPDPGAWLVHAPDPGDPWIRVERVGGQPPAYGWKLHVSATEWSGRDVLARVLPLLLAEAASFKLAATSGTLAGLNEGEGGLEQIGKFVTVYPRDDGSVVRIAGDLHRATVGLRGPVVRTDRSLVAGSLVHYRFGPFIDVPPTDRPEPPDPFGVPPPGPGAIAERYVARSTLHRSPRGSVQLAGDLVSGRTCILKRAYRDARVSPEGRDARDRLRREAELLRRLSPDPRFPEVVDLMEDGEDLVLVLGLLEGATLHRIVTEEIRAGRPPGPERIVRWGRGLAAALGAVHAAAIVHRDVNPLNVVVGPGDAIGLVDFEMATDGTGELPPGGMAGFSSPQQDRGEPATVADDVYGLGAVLAFAATGVRPSEGSPTDRLHDRPADRLDRAVGPALENVLRRCLLPDPARRFRTAREVDAALAAISASRGRAG